MTFKKPKKCTYFVSTTSELLESDKLKETLNEAISEIFQEFNVEIQPVRKHLNTTYLDNKRVQYVICYCRITLHSATEEAVRELLQKKYPSVRFDKEPPQFVY